MKFSLAWLNEWVVTESTTEQLLELMTSAGLEVEATNAVAAPFEQVLVGQVLAVEPHPNADRLTVCQVAVNQTEPLTIVCGAKNVVVDMKVPVAMIGAQLGDLTIKKSKLRGVASHGMLCSATELGLADESSGILALPVHAELGQSVRDCLQLDDQIIDLNLTPNRGDCLSIAGIARDVAALTEGDYRVQSITKVPSQLADVIPVTLQEPQGCRQYVGRIMRGIDTSVVTPWWMQERLRRSGLRIIHPVVDVTNYVMLELGQPMHGFDLARIDQEIIVRRAQAGETLTLLDESTITLREDSLVIADANKPLALAGVMGGIDSAVTDQTQDVFLESAYFDFTDIAGKARSYQITTDSAHRFERGVDPALQVQAMERATQLLLEIVGGQAGPLIHEKISDALPQVKQIILRPDRVNSLLGMVIESEKMRDILQRLGMTVIEQTDHWQVQVPSYRFDITMEVDLIEEIARVYGYQQLPEDCLTTTATLQLQSESQLSLTQIKQTLVGLGYHESIHYSFVDPKLQQCLAPQIGAIDLANPLAEDLSQMRVSLWPGLLTSVRYNQHRQQESMRLFEVGLTFTQSATKTLQTNQLAGVIAGSAQQEQWHSSNRQYDFFDIKADVMKLLQLTGHVVRFDLVKDQHPALHPGQTAQILKDKEPIGWVGALHPSLVQQLELTAPVFLFELQVVPLQSKALTHYQPLSKFPSVQRDLSFILEESVTAQAVMGTVQDSGAQWLQHVTIFDVYQGEGILPGMKSMAIQLTFQHPQRTLLDDDIDQAVTVIIEKLKQQLHIQLRD
ncbi:MAG: phenylalanine--tRNA ligase subunit beta [Legionellales bacterium]|nr:phenylalanine--tRNA ligase subunit beta [Legionellales bacterium]